MDNLVNRVDIQVVYILKSDLVTELTAGSVIEAGTDGGGSIEVYANKSDANKRNDYLAGLDGTILSSGSHKAVGTVVIRTSSNLKASQQTKIEADIENALLGKANDNSGNSETTKTTEKTTTEDTVVKETRERISYNIDSTWEKEDNDEDGFWLYLSYETEEEGFLSVQTSSLGLDFPVVDIEVLNVGLDSGIDAMEADTTLQDYNVIERTEIQGIPIAKQEYKFIDTDSYNKEVYSSYTNVFSYGENYYIISAVFPEDVDNQFFKDNLEKLMGSLVIQFY